MNRKDSLTEASDLPLAEPEMVGMSLDRLCRIRPAMQSYVDRDLVSGVVTLIARQGRVVYLDAVGFRDVEAKTPMKTDTIFRIMSMTKPITSVALMMLYEEGRFLLSDPISKWIPEFSDPMVATPRPQRERTSMSYKLVPANRPITILHLLTQTAGLSYWPRGITLKEFRRISERQSSDETIGDFIKRYARIIN